MSVVGVDGCADGWVYVIENGSMVSAAVVSTFKRLLDEVGGGSIVAIDVPIGLTSAGPREADREARRLLGRPRASSVFPAPVRATLDAQTYEAACDAHRAADGRKLSRQAFGILAKIQEVDAELVGSPKLQARVREVHPEVCFAVWNGAAMAHRKATPAGRAEREALIDAEWPGHRRRLLTAVHRHRCAPDDLNDAFAALWSARRIRDGLSVVLPESPPVDSAGLHMETVA